MFLLPVEAGPKLRYLPHEYTINNKAHDYPRLLPQKKEDPPRTLHPHTHGELFLPKAYLVRECGEQRGHLAGFRVLVPVHNSRRKGVVALP